MVWKKLGWKDHDPILVVGAPASFEPALAELAATVARDPSATPEVGFVLGFATTLREVEALAAVARDHTRGDAIVWVAYPKGSSRRLRCEFHRDNGFAALGAVGFEPVRQVAIDEDWSALRFRRVEHIRTLTRAPSMALSEEGRRRTGGA